MHKHDNLEKEIYRLMDGFFVESKDQYSNERTLDRLNQDRHLFIENLMQLFVKHEEEMVKNMLYELDSIAILNDNDGWTMHEDDFHKFYMKYLVDLTKKEGEKE